MIKHFIYSCLRVIFPDLYDVLPFVILLSRHYGNLTASTFDGKSAITDALKLGAGLALVLTLASCASVSVDKGTEQATTRQPQKVYVALFEVDQGKFKVDREGAELAAFQQNLQIMLQKGMVTDLNRRLIAAVPAGNESAFPPENAWVIRGKFTRVEQGSRFLRGAVGFGAGGTKMETSVYVDDLNQSSTTPFLTFSTTGGSGAEPGAITALATDPVELAVQAAAGSASGIGHGVTEDTARTAREITAELSDYMYRSGWISKDKWIQPKPLDKSSN